MYKASARTYFIGESVRLEKIFACKCRGARGDETPRTAEKNPPAPKKVPIKSCSAHASHAYIYTLYTYAKPRHASHTYIFVRACSSAGSTDISLYVSPFFFVTFAASTFRTHTRENRGLFSDAYIYLPTRERLHYIRSRVLSLDYLSRGPYSREVFYA